MINGNGIRYHRFRIFIVCAFVVVALAAWAPAVRAESNFWTDVSCSVCHVGRTDGNFCGMCHAHGVHSSSGKSNINVAGVTNKTSYSPGETVSVTISGGYRPSGGTHTARAILYDQNGAQLAVSKGTLKGGIGPVDAPRWPVTLTAAAPTAPGTYTWQVAWYGNAYDQSGAAFGAPGTGWIPDPNNPNHGQEKVFTNSFTVVGAPPSRRTGQIDFDGDAKTDMTLWRASTGYWLTLRSSNGTNMNTQYGASGDLFVPADYDGDGKADVAVYRPSTGGWFIVRSSNGTTQSAVFGVSGDTPVPGDYDGDGKADIAVYRPSTGGWFIVRSSNGTTQSAVFGVSGDTPVPGDYDGDGKTDIAVYRPSSGGWFIIRSSNGTTQSAVFGISGDTPVPGDYDGDGKADIAIYRPITGAWFILRSSNGTTAAISYGEPSMNDQPVPGDYDGDGKTDLAVYRPGYGNWFVSRSSDGGTQSAQFGSQPMGDVPVFKRY